MGLKAGSQLLHSIVNYTDNATKLVVTKGYNTMGIFCKKATPINPTDLKDLRLSLKDIGDTVKVSKPVQKMKLKNFSTEEILDMKPSTFKKILDERTDIPSYIDKKLLTPEKLNLYDELMGIEAVQKIPQKKLDKILTKLFSEYNLRNSEPGAQLEIIPELIRKGFDLDILANLPITHRNKNQIEYLLKKSDISDVATGNTEYIFKLVTDDNIKYLDELLSLGETPTCLPFWTDDTAKIIREFRSDDKLRNSIDDDTVKSQLAGSINPKTIQWARERLLYQEKTSTNIILDRILRRGHNYISVKHILGIEPLTSTTSRLLEFKDFDLLKNIGLDDLEKISVQERKDFLNSFISAISPNDVRWKNSMLKEISILQSKMKIFKYLDMSSQETFSTSYGKIVKRILDSIPIDERKIIDTVIDTKTYRRDYRLANPIPPLVNDIESVLKIKTVDYNGKKIKLATIKDEQSLAIAAHSIPNKEAINIIEALEITDPNMLLCIGINGAGKPINLNKGGYAIALRPRKAADWHVQANTDIDSGTGAYKNIYCYENCSLPIEGDKAGTLSLLPNSLKNILDLSQRQYSARMFKIKDCKTLEEIEKIDLDLAKAIQKVIKENKLSEGLIRPEPMGVLVRNVRKLSEVDNDILDYCIHRDIPIISVKS